MPKEEREQISQRNPLSVTMSEAGSLHCPTRGCATKEVHTAKEIVLLFVSETPLSFVQKQADRQGGNDNSKTKGKTCITESSSHWARLPREAVQIPSLLQYSLGKKNLQTSALNDRWKQIQSGTDRWIRWLFEVSVKSFQCNQYPHGLYYTMQVIQ